VTGYLFQLFYATAAFGVCIDISDNCSGTVTGVMNTCGQIGALFMAIIFGKVVDLTHSYNTPLYVIAGVLFTGSLTCLLLEPTRKLKGEIEKLKIMEVATPGRQ
jgi:nitrate/nitrite transporter NarK